MQKLFCTLFTVLAFDAIAQIVPTGTLSVNLYDSLSGKPTAARVRITRNNYVVKILHTGVPDRQRTKKPVTEHNNS